MALFLKDFVKKAPIVLSLASLLGLLTVLIWSSASDPWPKGGVWPNFETPMPPVSGETSDNKGSLVLLLAAHPHKPERGPISQINMGTLAPFADGFFQQRDGRWVNFLDNAPTTRTGRDNGEENADRYCRAMDRWFAHFNSSVFVDCGILKVESDPVIRRLGCFTYLGDEVVLKVSPYAVVALVFLAQVPLAFMCAEYLRRRSAGSQASKC